MALDYITRTDPSAPISSLTSITIDADTDANGSGTIDLRTRNLQRLQITNAGNVSVANKIGVNQPVPISALHINATYAVATTASEYPIRLRPPSGAGDFCFMLNTTMFSTQRDDIVWWGWNIDNAVVGEPSIHFAMEREFGANPDWEVHLEADPTSAAIIRYWTWNIHRGTGASTHVTRTDTYSLTSATSGAQLFQVNASEILINQPTQVRMLTDLVVFETVNNAGAPAKQLSIRPHPSDNQLSWFVFGDPGSGGGISIYPDTSFTNVLYVRSGGSSLTNGADVRADRFSATTYYDGSNNQVVTTRGAAVADATGAGDVVAQLNTLLARLRTHGLIAT